MTLRVVSCVKLAITINVVKRHCDLTGYSAKHVYKYIYMYIYKVPVRLALRDKTQSINRLSINLSSSPNEPRWIYSIVTQRMKLWRRVTVMRTAFCSKSSQWMDPWRGKGRGLDVSHWEASSLSVAFVCLNDYLFFCLRFFFFFFFLEMSMNAESKVRSPPNVRRWTHVL